MGVDSNFTTVTPGVTTECNATELCVEASSFLGADLLQFAPCPPPWRKDLLWEVAKLNGLNEGETGQIASRCFVPRLQGKGHGPGPGQGLCGTSCIAICIISGCILLTVCLAIMCWCRRRGAIRKRPRSVHQNNAEQEVPGSKQDLAVPEYQEGCVHYHNITESAYDNRAYLPTEHARSNSDTSNNSHTELNGISSTVNHNTQETDISDCTIATRP